MERNIPILYVLASLGNAWLWLSVWALYYLLYTDYAGIALIEMCTWFALTFVEIPSGAFADLFGKKTSLITGYILLGIGNIIMFAASNIWMLIGAVITIAVGLGFLSGAFEALTYDSLHAKGEERLYEKVYARQKSITLFTHVVAAFLGGIVYTHFTPGSPFLITGVLGLSAAFLACFLVEIKVTHEVDKTFSALWAQNKHGFTELFYNHKLAPYTYLFLLISVVPIVMYEYAAELLVIEKGATAEAMGIIIPIILLTAAVSSYVAPSVVKCFGRVRTYLVVGFVYALLLILVPWSSLLLVVTFNLFWAGTSVIRQIIESKIINDDVSPKNRATTLSTLNMLKYLPYAAIVIFAGHFADLYKMATLVSLLGIVMLLLTLIALFQFLVHMRNIQV